MKIRNVYDEIFSMENLYNAYEEAKRGRRYNRDVLEYSNNLWENLKGLHDMIISGQYKIDKYYIFYVYEPKKRMIMSINFEHRIVQWAIYKIINPLLVNGYIKDTYGCIKGRGPLQAMQRVRYWIKNVSRKKGKWYYLKLDISKYFYRISHEVLKNLLRKKIKDNKLMEIIENIIDCEHTPFGLPPGKSPGEVPIENRLYDVGMPIGNLLSQMFANIYLDAVDQYCKRTLRIKYYVRYMDDIVIMSDSKKQLHEWKEKIKEYFENELRLNLNNKTCIRPVSQGMEFVGYRIWKYKTVLRKSTTLKMKRRLKLARYLYGIGRIDFKKVTETFMSYIGRLCHTDSRRLKRLSYEEMVLTHEGFDGKEEHGRHSRDNSRPEQHNRHTGRDDRETDYKALTICGD